MSTVRPASCTPASPQPHTGAGANSVDPGARKVGDGRLQLRTNVAAGEKGGPSPRGLVRAWSERKASLGGPKNPTKDKAGGSRVFTTSRQLLARAFPKAGPPNAGPSARVAGLAQSTERLQIAAQSSPAPATFEGARGRALEVKLLRQGSVAPLLPGRSPLEMPSVPPSGAGGRSAHVAAPTLPWASPHGAAPPLQDRKISDVEAGRGRRLRTPSGLFYQAPSASAASLESLADTLPAQHATVQAASQQGDDRHELLTTVLRDLSRRNQPAEPHDAPALGPEVAGHGGFALRSQSARAALGASWLRQLSATSEETPLTAKDVANVFHFLVARLERLQPMFTRGVFSLGGPLAHALADAIVSERRPAELYERRSSHLNHFPRRAAFAERFALGACGIDFPLGTLTGEHRTLLLIEVDDLAPVAGKTSREHLGRRLFFKPEHAGLSDLGDLVAHVWHYTQSQGRSALGHQDAGWDRRERVVRSDLDAFAALALHRERLPHCSEAAMNAKHFGALSMRPALALDLGAPGGTVTPLNLRAINLLEQLQRRPTAQIGNEVCFELDAELLAYADEA